MAEITAEDIGLPVDPAIDQEKLSRAIASASDKPGVPTKWNLGDARSPRQILEDELAAKQNLPLQMTDASGVQIAPNGISVSSVMTDPNFRALPDAERRKVIETVLAQDSGFQGLPKEEQAKVRDKLMPKPGFFASMTEGGPRAMASESLPGMLAQRMKDVREAMPQLQADDTAERQRRIAAGESLNGMEQWRLNHLNEIIQEGKPERPPMSKGEIWEAVKKEAVDNPTGTLGKLARGLVTAPEIIAMPQSIPLRAGELVSKFGRIAETVARTAADVAQVSGAVGAESTLRQLNEFGQAGPEQTTMDMVMTAVPMVGLRALLPRTKAQVGMAADLALAKEAKAKGFDPSSELTVNVVQDVESRVSQGQPVDAALKDALEAVKVSPEAAADAAAMLKPEEAHATETGVEPQGDQQQHIGTNASRIEAAQPQADRGNRPVAGAEVPQAEAGVAAPEAPAPKEAQVIRPQQFRPLPEEVPKGFVAPDEARAIYEMAGVDAEAAAKMADKPIAMGALRQRLTTFMGGQKYADSVLVDAVREGKLGKQTGQIDPRLLKVLGVSAAIGLGVGGWTQDPKDAVIAALATGGVLAAGSLLKRGAKALGEATRDERYRVGTPVEKFTGDVRWGRFRQRNFRERAEALVPNEKQREQVTMYLQGDESIKLTPAQQQLASAYREFFKANGEKGLQAGAIEGLIDDYVTQLWTGLNKNDSLARNLINSLGKGNVTTGGMSPRSRFGLERVIPSYKEGMARGMIPSTLDIAKIGEIYGNSIDRAIANKNFEAALKRERTPDGRIILGTRDQIIKNLSKTLDETRKQWGGENALVDDIRRFAESKISHDYEVVTHRQLPGMLVHKDVAPVLKWFYDTSDPNAATKLAYAVAVAAKRGIFSYSFFHVKSLAEVMLGMPMNGWLNVANGNAWALLKGRGNQGVMENMIRGGLNVTDHPLEGDVTPFSHALQLIYERHPIIGAPVKGLDVVQRAMNAFLWDVVQPTFKTAVAMAAYEKVLKNSNNPAFLTRVADKVLGRREADLSVKDAGKIAASAANDFFGGVDWFSIADGVQNKYGRSLALAVTAPAGRRFMQIMALAPDWTVATARSMFKAIPGISRREIAALHQGYVVRQALLYLTVVDGINQYYSGHHVWENEDPTMIDLGDGRKLQAAKHFMEPIHWLVSPEQQAWNKLGYVPKEFTEQLFNKKWISLKGGDVGGPRMVPKDANLLEALGVRVQHAAGGAMPIGAQMWFDQGYQPALSGVFGLPIYGKTDEQAIEQARKRAESEGKNADKAAARVTKQRETKRRKAEEARAQ